MRTPHNKIKQKDLVGQRYGELVIQREVEKKIFPSGQTQRQFLCKCSCGNTTRVLLGNLRIKNTTSCGCVWKRNIYKHGLIKHPLYKVWSSMKDRCNNKNNPNYHYYGGRGITVCKRWYNFEHFYTDLGSKWKKGLTLERVDNNKGYSPGNVVFATMAEQCENRREKVFTHPMYKNKIHEETNIRRILQREVREREIRAQSTIR